MEINDTKIGAERLLHIVGADFEAPAKHGFMDTLQNPPYNMFPLSCRLIILPAVLCLYRNHLIFKQT